MINKIIFYPNRHDCNIEGLIAKAIQTDYSDGKLDSLFFETFPQYIKTNSVMNLRKLINLIPNEIPLFGAEYLPYHKKHFNSIGEIVSFYKMLKAGLKIDREKKDFLMQEHKKISRSRMKAIMQNLLVKCYDEDLKKPGIVCGRNHFNELKEFFESRNYPFKISEDYLFVFDNKRDSNYAVRKFTLPLISER
jgi:hypothetical protein